MTKKHTIDRTIFPENANMGAIVLSRTTEERTLKRAQSIVRTYSTDSAARAYLSAVGFTPAVLREGWELYNRAYGVRDDRPDAPAPPPAAVLADVERLENEAASIFLRARAVLHRFYPAQEAFVFDGLNTPSGFEAVPAMNTFLDRVDQLEQGARKDTKKQDETAVLALDARGITKDLRQELRDLCAAIESSPVSTKILQAAAPSDDDRTIALRALHAWVQDWSDTARAVIPDKRILRKMGIGKRRARTKDDPAPPNPEPPAPNGTTQHA